MASIRDLSTGKSGFEIKNDHSCQIRHNDLPDPFMFRMGQVGVTTGIAVEGHDETMGETVIKAFRAVIRSMFQREKSWNPSHHRTHFRETLVDL